MYMYMNKGLNSVHILLKLCESCFFFITNGQLVCKVAQAEMCLDVFECWTKLYPKTWGIDMRECTCKMW